MVAIKGKDTKPELFIKLGLYSRGFRYRLNYKTLCGKPDLVLKSTGRQFLSMEVFDIGIIAPFPLASSDKDILV